MIASKHTIHGADVNRLKDYYQASRELSSTTRESQRSVHIRLTPALNPSGPVPYDITYYALIDLERYLNTWDRLDAHIIAIAEELDKSPPGTSLSDIRYRRMGATNRFITWVGKANSRPSWHNLTEFERHDISYQPDFLETVRDVPEHIVQSTRSAYYESIERYIPIFTIAAHAELEVEVQVYKIIGVKFEGSVSGTLTGYQDGSFVLELEATGQIALTLAKVASVGYEESGLLRYRFGSEYAAQRFMNRVTDLVETSENNVVSEYLEGSTFLVNNITLKGVVVDFDFPVANECEATVRGGVGYDNHTGEQIRYFGLEGELKTKGKEGVAIDVNLDISEINGPLGDRVVIEGYVFGGAVEYAGILGAQGQKWTGGTGRLRAELDLDDLEVRDAWSRFLNGHMNFSELHEYARVTISTGVEKGIGVDVEVGGHMAPAGLGAEVEGSAEVHLLSFHKEPRGSMHLVQTLPKAHLDEFLPPPLLPLVPV